MTLPDHKPPPDPRPAGADQSLPALCGAIRHHRHCTYAATGGVVSPLGAAVDRGTGTGFACPWLGAAFHRPLGDRLRDWLGLDAAGFYDLERVAIVPMAFCFPGYDAKGADLPPPRICAATWREQVMAALPGLRLVLAIGTAAIRWHLGKPSLAAAMADWRHHTENGVFPLPHPSWRNTGWLKRNPWFEADLLPELRQQVARALSDPDGPA